MAKNQINPVLLDVAAWRLAGENEKRAFVPAGADPMAAAGGMPPGDPMAAAGGAPPMPMDPMAAGGVPPGMPPDPMAMAGAPAAAPAAGAPGAAAKPKVDPAFIYLELSRVRKLLTHFMQQNGVDLPPDILDDGSVAQVMQGAEPQSAPLGQGGQSEQPAGAAPGGPQLPAVGGAPAVGAVESPMKQGSDVVSLFRAPADPGPQDFTDRIDALSQLSRNLGTQ